MGEIQEVIKQVNILNGEDEEEESISFEAFILHMKS